MKGGVGGDRLVDVGAVLHRVERATDRRQIFLGAAARRQIGRFDYVNIKLDKTGGLTEALALAEAARAHGFRLMVGCMFGSGLAVALAFVVASLCEVVDLDVPLMVHDPADAAVRHDGCRLHGFAPALWG